MSVHQDLHNVAIVAHVDYGKTTLVDMMLWRSGTLSERNTVEKTGGRVMDSGDLEREKNITILAKNTAVHYSDPAAKALGLEGGVTINVVGTSGHADSGGETRRGLFVVDGIILMVNASEGPLPQTRFVLRRTLQAQLPVAVVASKVDRPDSRIEEVVSEVTDLLFSFNGDPMNDGVETDVDSLLDIPVIYTSAEASVCLLENSGSGILPTRDLEPLFETILGRIFGPFYEEDAPLQAHVTNPDASPFLDRLTPLRIHNGILTKGASLGLTCHGGIITNVHITELLCIGGLERISTESADPGEIVAVAGIEDIIIGELLVDSEDPRPLSFITINDPAISAAIGINTSFLTGRIRSAKVTARQVKGRLDRELVGNVSPRVPPTECLDAWRVQGRSELALAALVEQICREGFELVVGKPQIVTKGIEGVRRESMERMTIDVLKEHLGAITQLMVARKGRMETMSNHGSGRIRLEFVVPAHDLIGFRTRFLMETRGAGIVSSTAKGYAPQQGAIEQRLTNLLIASRAGQATPHAMTNLQRRSSFIVEPSSEVYGGRVANENPRGEDIDVSICCEEKQANTCSATADVHESFTLSCKLTLEGSLESMVNNECVEMIPDAVRVRKVVLDAQERFKITVQGRRA